MSLSLLGSNVFCLPISSTDLTFNIEIPSTQVASNSYTVPSDGLYKIDYSFRIGQGISAELLSGNRPGIIITKTVGSVTSALDYRYFGSVNILDLTSFIGLNLVVANVTLTQGQISHIYKLQTGDVLKFGIVQGGLTLGLITDKSTEISIYKVR